MRYYVLGGSAPRIETRRPFDFSGHKKRNRSYKLGVLSAAGAFAPALPVIPGQISFYCACCENTRDPCDLLRTTGDYETVSGSWTNPATAFNYDKVMKTTSSNAVIKWNEASPFGNNYVLAMSMTIQTAGDIGKLLFNYDYATDTYDYVEVVAGSAVDGTGGQITVYVGGSPVMTDTTINIKATALLSLTINLGVLKYNTTVCTSSSTFGTVDAIKVSFSGGAVTNGNFEHSYPTSITGSATTFGYGSGPSNSGYVEFNTASTFWQVSPSNAMVVAGQTLCNYTTEPCTDCKDATRKRFCTVEFTSPAPGSGDALLFSNQTYECEISSACQWALQVYDGPPSYYEHAVEVSMPCCSGVKYLLVYLRVTRGFVACETVYYNINSYDQDCAFGTLVLNAGNTDSGLSSPGDCLPCGLFSTPIGWDPVQGSNTITLTFHD